MRLPSNALRLSCSRRAMASNKRSARQRQRAVFEAQLDDMSDVFSREERRQERFEQRKEAALRHRACESKNRYATRLEAEDAIAACAAYGRVGLTCYRCAHCKGWHLTSHARA